MKIISTVKTPTDTHPEVGFIHENGALVLKTKEGCLVLGGFWGSYASTEELYIGWRKSSTKIITSKDSVELSFNEN